MKIGIVTFHNAHNFGAVIQAWALQEYLYGLGYDAEIINYRHPDIEKVYRLINPSKPYKVKVLNIIYNTLRLMKALLNYNKSKKYYIYTRFVNKRLKIMGLYNNYKNLRNAKIEHDILIAGSDQIWNEDITKGLHPAFFLAFGKKEAKRISYAASIGKTHVSDEELLFFQRYLKNFDYISVREKTAKDAINHLTSKNIDVVLDPTLLLDRNKYDLLKNDPRIKSKYIYVHNVGTKRVDKDLFDIAEEISNKTGVPIIHNRSNHTCKNDLKINATTSPEKTIGYIANAEYVITNSYHATIFSILYQRKFFTMPYFKRPERMIYLLNSLGLNKQLVNNVKDLPVDKKMFAIDYNRVEKLLKKQKELSISFLINAISGERLSNKPAAYEDLYLSNADVFNCYGCSACNEVCPESAITMKTDNDGFKYPSIDFEKCTNCDLCKKYCIYSKYINYECEDQYPLVYAAYNNDTVILDKSTSGGVFTSLAELTLNKGGIVFGVRFDEDMNVIYDVADNQSKCNTFNGSKYVTADNEGILSKVKKSLEAGEYVLFTGTPCQAAGLKSYLSQDYEKLHIVDIICKGTSSPKYYKRYIEYLEAANEAKVTNIKFRSKLYGWESPYLSIKFCSGKKIIESYKSNVFAKAYSKNLTLRPSCFNCEFASLKCGVGDITIGDYWGITQQHPEMHNKKGVSIIRINNKKGIDLFDQIKNSLTTFQSSYEKAYAKNHKKAVPLTMERIKLMSVIDEIKNDTLFRAPITSNHIAEWQNKAVSN